MVKKISYPILGILVRLYFVNNGYSTQRLISHRIWCYHLCFALRWRHNDHAGVSNHQPHGCLLNRLYRRTSKKISKLRVTGLCAGNSPGTGEFPAQMASYAENVSIWWRHHGIPKGGADCLKSPPLWYMGFHLPFVWPPIHHLFDAKERTTMWYPWSNLLLL